MKKVIFIAIKYGLSFLLLSTVIVTNYFIYMFFYTDSNPTAQTGYIADNIYAISILVFLPVLYFFAGRMNVKHLIIALKMATFVEIGIVLLAFVSAMFASPMFFYGMGFLYILLLTWPFGLFMGEMSLLVPLILYPFCAFCFYWGQKRRFRKKGQSVEQLYIINKIGRFMAYELAYVVCLLAFIMCGFAFMPY